MHSDVQVPWLWISCNGTLELKVKVAPEHRKAWKVILESCSWREANMRAKFFLNLESVSGSHFVDFLIWNKGYSCRLVLWPEVCEVP